MTETQVRQALEEWCNILCKVNVPYAIAGSVAMLLHECEHGRDSFKDIDFLVPVPRTVDRLIGVAITPESPTGMKRQRNKRNTS